jgi:hypothetical protein
MLASIVRYSKGALVNWASEHGAGHTFRTLTDRTSRGPSSELVANWPRLLGSEFPGGLTEIGKLPPVDVISSRRPQGSASWKKEVLVRVTIPPKILVAVFVFASTSVFAFVASMRSAGMLTTLMFEVFRSFRESGDCKGVNRKVDSRVPEVVQAGS